MLKFDERFARQYRYELPSEFPLTSPSSSIVHHLSGPNGQANTQTFLLMSKSVGRAPIRDTNSHFHYACKLSVRKLAQSLDSLVRVSRRGEERKPNGT